MGSVCHCRSRHFFIFFNISLFFWEKFPSLWKFFLAFLQFSVRSFLTFSTYLCPQYLMLFRSFIWYIIFSNWYLKSSSFPFFQHDLDLCNWFGIYNNEHAYDYLQGRTVLYHDFVFWCGDFNYRLNMSRDEVKAAVEVGNCHRSTFIVSPVQS